MTFVTEDTDGTHDVATFKMDLMGTNCDEASFGPAVHELVEKSWSSIFTDGLSKEVRDALRKKYLTPQNLPLAKAPTLNLEIRQAIPSTAVKRDDYQVTTQHLPGATIVALAQLMTELLKPDERWDFKRIFEVASDAGRLISHVQYHMTKSRRALITPMLSVSARNALEASSIDKQLFGEQYLDKIKDAAVADKLVRTLTSATKQKTLVSGKTQLQTRPPLQGNVKAFAQKPMSRRGAKATPRMTERRSNSRTRNTYYRR